VRPLHRYDAVGAFWAALLGAADARATGFPLSGPSAAAAVRRSSAPPPRPPAEPERPRRGGSRTLVFGAAAGALVLIVAAGVSAGLRASKRQEGAAGSATAGPEGASSSSTPSSSSAATLPSGPTSAASSAAAPSACPPGAALISGGRFPVGSEELKGSGPRHNVFIDTFCLDTTEVTAAEYARCVELGVCARPTTQGVERAEACTFGKDDRKAHPINCVTFEEALTYCENQGKRLPTEAEWEVAATRGESGATPWAAEGPLAERANLPGEPFEATAPVGALAGGASPEGVLDLVGNVAEWQADWLAPYPGADVVNPRGPAQGSLRAVRGAWFGGCCVEPQPNLGKPFNVRLRDGLAPSSRAVSVGFRCARPIAR
jgi:formylglycine-generating enzyme required for sulfatase activity